MARLVIDVDSDSEEDKNGMARQGDSFMVTSTGAKGIELDVKPNIRDLLFPRKSQLSAASNAEETTCRMNEQSKVGTDQGRPFKKVKTELGEARGEGADRQGQVAGKAFQSSTIPGKDGPFVDVKPKLELLETAGGARAPQKPGGLLPASEKATGVPEPYEASNSGTGQPAVAQPSNTRGAGEDVRAGTRASEPDPDEGLEDGEIEDVDARILRELEEDVRKHAELLKKKQEELERGAVEGGGQSPLESQGPEGGSGTGPESRELVRSIGVESNAAEVPPRRAGGNRQFWHAGEYEVQQGVVRETTGELQHMDKLEL